MEILLTTDNTEGYTQTELNNLNYAWEEIVEKNELEEYTTEYNDAASAFCDAVARR